MKRLVIMAVMAAFILGTVGMAQAAKLTISGGDFRVHGNYVTNPNFDEDYDDDKFNLYQRFRTTFNFVANENLKGVVQLQFGGDGSDARWGHGERAGVSKGGFADVNFRQAYLDFMIPNTQAQVKAGWQWWALPNTIGSHIFDARSPAFLLTVPFNDMVGMTLGYSRSDDNTTRLYDNTKNDYTKTEDEIDHFVAIVPINLDGFAINPFAHYAMVRKNAGNTDSTTDGSPLTSTFASTGNEKDQDIIFLGINATMNIFDPITVHADFNYGHASKRTSGGDSQRGWIADLAVSYAMDFMTPMIFGLYESGQSSSGNDKIMPSLGLGDLNFSSFSTGGAQLGGTAWYGGDRMVQDTAMPGFSTGAIGRMGLGLKVMDISFMDKLSHKFLLAYYQGTNDDSRVTYFTTKDSAWEVNFDTSYQMYENLAAIVELGYISPSLDNADDRGLSDDASFKAAAGFRYQF